MAYAWQLENISSERSFPRGTESVHNVNASSASATRKQHQISMPRLDLLCLSCSTPCSSNERDEQWEFNIEDGVFLKRNDKSKKSRSMNKVTVFRRRIQPPSTLSSV